MIGEKVSDVIKAAWPIINRKDAAEDGKDKKKGKNRTDL